MKDWNKELESLMDMSLELLATLDSDSPWTKDDEDKLKCLTKLTNLIGKVQKIVGDRLSEVPTLEEDDIILSNFLTRHSVLTIHVNIAQSHK